MRHAYSTVLQAARVVEGAEREQESRCHTTGASCFSVAGWDAMAPNCTLDKATSCGTSEPLRLGREAGRRGAGALPAAQLKRRDANGSPDTQKQSASHHQRPSGRNHVARVRPVPTHHARAGQGGTATGSSVTAAVPPRPASRPGEKKTLRTGASGHRHQNAEARCASPTHANAPPRRPYAATASRH